ncbi:MAG TPA: hypothetical protein VHY34_11030 [Caulobacteraceae bacterium]|jgi:hypothetical protein|nr:hypothetical protein [Caulobacteraceae bacterium]
MGLALDRAAALRAADRQGRSWVAMIHWPRVLALVANLLAWALIAAVISNLVSR